jgi:hypothetical protein
MYWDIRRRKKMEFLVAVAIVVFLMWKFFGFRAYMLFSSTLISPVCALCGLLFIASDGQTRIVGIVMLVFGILLGIFNWAMYYYTGKRVPEENRTQYYKALFLCGFWSFTRALAICMIIGIPFMKWLTGNYRTYREVVLVSNGVKCGTVLVDQDNMDPNGNQYEEVN